MTESQFAVLFADVAGSSKLYKQIGDQAAKEAIDKGMTVMESIINVNGGTVIKTIGDEIMARFDSADDAMIATVAIQQHFESDTGPIAVRAGFHFGPAILQNNDVFGDAVNTAARMVAAANAWQIVTSEDTIQHLSDEHKDKATRFDYAKIKAFDQSVPLYLINWEANVGSVTQVISVARPNTSEIQKGLIVLQFGSEKYAISPEMCDYTIGRETSCNLVIPSPFASRTHAWIEYRRKKFVLVDHSTNGTWVRTGDNQEMFLKREQLPLWGSGVISLGEPIANNKDFIISYTC